jgi:hypothetical protein
VLIEKIGIGDLVMTVSESQVIFDDRREWVVLMVGSLLLMGVDEEVMRSQRLRGV